MNKRLVLLLTIICSGAILDLTTPKVLGAASYSLSASPSTVNLGQNVTLTVSWNGGTAGASYTFKITVTKPGGAGSAWASVSRNANSTGGQTVAATYPNPNSAWTLVSGTINTDIEGTYSVTVDKTAPNPVVTGVASPTTFVVKHNISVAITSPSPSGSYYRGDLVTITAALTDANGQKITTGSAAASTPKSSLTLPETSSPGIYSAQYQIQLGDTLGNWNLTVSGTLPGGNYGSSTIYVTILPAQLIVSSLATFNAQGNPTADFSPGDSLYATFRIAYSSSGFLQQGSFDLKVQDPSGTTVATLVAIYDQSRDLFYDPSGFQVSSSDTAGAWQIVFSVNSLNDSYGNLGPSSAVTYRFQIHQPSSSAVISPIYFGIAALAIGGGLGATLVARQFNKVKTPFDDLFKLTGGAIQAPASILISGDSGAGTTTMGLQLLYRDLAAGKYCGLLSYDAFPSEIKRRMRDMGWDIAPFLENGHLKILDIYSALAGVEGTTIREPTDFTEISIQTTDIIENAKGPVTLLLDSVTPMFNAAATKDCINFLQVIAAKVKNSGGIFIFTATKGSIPEEARVKIESLADGVIEMSLVKRAKTLTRLLMVRKISGRQISSTETEFEIVTGKGILLVKDRLPLGFLSKN